MRKGVIMNTTINTNRRVAAPEFWRFFFIMAIALLHFEEDLFNRVHWIAEGGYLGVEFFFLISGFVIALQYKTKKDSFNAREICFKRLQSIYPDYLWAILVMTFVWIVTEATGIHSTLKHIYLNRLQFIFSWSCLKYGNLEMRSLWFIAYWIFLYCVIVLNIKWLRSHTGRVVSMLCAMATFAYYAIHHGCLYSDPRVTTFFEPRMFRSAATMLLGMSLYDVYDRLKNIQLSKFGYWIISLLELVVIADCIYMMTCNSRTMADFVVVFCFCIIIMLAFVRKTWLAKWLDGKLSLFLGKLSMPIFMYHIIVVYVFQHYLHAYITNRYVLYSLFIVSVILFAWLMSVFTGKLLRPWIEKFVNSLVMHD